MFGLDKVLKVPGELAKEMTIVTAQLPSLPLDIAEKVTEGLQEGIEKATDSKDR